MTEIVVQDSIEAALNRVWDAVGYVQKERGKGLPYSFLGEAALIEAVRPAMIEEAIVVYPKKVMLLSNDTYTTSGGTVMNSRLVQAVFCFTHAPSGTFIDVESLGEGADPGDKAIGKALTGALKYALRQALLISTGDDPDQTSSDVQERPQRAPAVITTGDPASIIRSLEAQGELTRKETSKFYGHTLGSLVRGDKQSFIWLSENWVKPEVKANAMRLRGLYDEHGWPKTITEENDERDQQELESPKVGSTATATSTPATPPTTGTDDPLVSELDREVQVEIGCGIMYRAQGKTYAGYDSPETHMKGVWADKGDEKLVGHISKWYMNEDPVDIATPPIDKIKAMKASDAYDLLEELGARDAVVEMLPRRIELYLPGSDVDTVLAKWLSDRYKDAHGMARGWKIWQKAVIMDLTPAEVVGLHKSLRNVGNPFQEEVNESDIDDVLDLLS